MRKGASASRLHSDGFLADAVAQVVELGSADLSAGSYLNLGNARRMQRERPLHPFAIGNLADSERLVDSRAPLSDHYPLEYLHTLLTAFYHTAMHLHGVAYVEGRYIALKLLLTNFIENVHLRYLLKNSRPEVKEHLHRRRSILHDFF